MQARLTITTPHGENFEKLIGNTAILGRGASVHVRLNGDPQVSRYHAMLRCHNGFQYQVIDLGSRNGTFLGQTRVLLPTALSDEAYLQVGDHEIFLQTVHSGASEHGMTLDPSACLDVVLLVVGLLEVEQRLHQLDPATFSEALGTWHRNLYAFLGSCHAKPDKFVNASMIAYWSGDPLPSMAIQALATAEAVVKYGSEREWLPGAPLQVVCGIHTGRVALGMAPGKDPTEPLLGGAVSAALRIQETAAKQNVGIAVSEPVYSLLPKAKSDSLHPIGYADVGGKTFTIPLFAVPQESSTP